MKTLFKKCSVFLFLVVSLLGWDLQTVHANELGAAAFVKITLDAKAVTWGVQITELSEAERQFAKNKNTDWTLSKLEFSDARISDLSVYGMSYRQIQSLIRSE